jgi:hypothetical protein
MSPRQTNQIISIVALIIIVITFLLTMTGTLPALAAIVVTLIVGFGVRIIRTRL